MKRSRAALLIWLVLFCIPLSEAQESIIMEENAPIHSVSTTAFTDWPGTSSVAALDIVATAGRIWLVWPQALISLQTNGSADTQTLLAYFHSQNTIEGERDWTPEAGAVCADGKWRGIDIRKGTASILWTKDPVSGNYSERELPFSLDGPPSVSAIDTNALLVRTASEAYLVSTTAVVNLKEKLAEWQPITLSAVSGDSGALAWWDNKNAGIRLGWLSVSDSANAELRKRIDDTRFISADTVSGFPRTAPISLSWAGDLLVCGYSDFLIIVRLQDSKLPALDVFTGKIMPDRWYRMSGSRDVLLLNEPGAGRVFVSRFNEERSSPTKRNEPLLNSLLRNELLNGGERLIASGEIKRAEMLYGWALPLVRSNRSRNPLDEDWPVLEKELYKRRNLLRDRLEAR